MGRDDRYERVIAEIEVAFAHESYPGDDEITDPLIGEVAEELAQLREDFRGKHWRQLTYTTLVRHQISFLNIAGLRFYLPAYLIGSLRWGGALEELTVSALRPLMPMPPIEHIPGPQTVWLQFTGTQELAHWKVVRYNQLTLEEKQVVHLFLELLRDESGSGEVRAIAQDTLRQYWEHF